MKNFFLSLALIGAFPVYAWEDACEDCRFTINASNCRDVKLEFQVSGHSYDQNNLGPEPKKKTFEKKPRVKDNDLEIKMRDILHPRRFHEKKSSEIKEMIKNYDYLNDLILNFFKTDKNIGREISEG